VGISESRKSKVETQPIVSKNRRTQHRPVKAALHGHPFRVNATEFARPRFLHLAAGAAAFPAVSRDASAQAYPTRPITMIVPLAAGGLVDVVARVVAERMRTSLGQTVIIENVGGADGTIATGRAARARPDGYTIEFGLLGTHVLNGAFYSLPYDVLNDFAPISALVATPIVLFARKTMPAKDLNELIDWLKANPNKASAGTTTLDARVAAAFLQKETETKFTLVPYRGGAPATQDLVKAGSIKAYAVGSEARLALAPDIPTFAEMGLPSTPPWLALFAPKGTPRSVVDKLNAAAREALADPTVRSRLLDLGQEIFPREQQTPEALGLMQRADAEKWWPIIKQFGIKAQ
jgi:tripartite-type tricarboxylate transporter receptor subunit TctC